jgi:hypothetical protein
MLHTRIRVKGLEPRLGSKKILLIAEYSFLVKYRHFSHDLHFKLYAYKNIRYLAFVSNV